MRNVPTSSTLIVIGATLAIGAIFWAQASAAVGLAMGAPGLAMIAAGVIAKAVATGVRESRP
jgi:hypothetical protein